MKVKRTYSKKATALQSEHKFDESIDDFDKLLLKDEK